MISKKKKSLIGGKIMNEKQEDRLLEHLGDISQKLYNINETLSKITKSLEERKNFDSDYPSNEK